MKIKEITHVTPELVDTLTTIWEKSVKATHQFLSAPEIAKIKEYVPSAIKEVGHLIIAADESGQPVAFMGIENHRLEMLFIAPEERGQGIGKKLLQYGIDNYAVNELTVNEQNGLAKGFYEHLNFEVYKRTETDEEGGPYPLLYMRLK